MEEYLGIGADGNVAASSNTDKEDYEVDMDGLEDAGTAFEPFKDLCKRRFLWYYESYLESIRKAKEEVKDGQAFVRMPFEGQGNTMDGKFHYTELEKRLRNIKKVLDEETNQQNANSANNGEDQNDTRFPGSPVLALDEVRDGSLAASDKGHLDGGHCDLLLDQISQLRFEIGA